MHELTPCFFKAVRMCSSDHMNVGLLLSLGMFLQAFALCMETASSMVYVSLKYSRNVYLGIIIPKKYIYTEFSVTFWMGKEVVCSPQSNTHLCFCHGALCKVPVQTYTFLIKWAADPLTGPVVSAHWLRLLKPIW